LLVHDKDGNDCGWCSKRFPATGEIDAGVVPGRADQKLIEWDGLKVTGAATLTRNLKISSQIKRNAALI
jgi:hypothetical protein